MVDVRQVESLQAKEKLVLTQVDFSHFHEDRGTDVEQLNWIQRLNVRDRQFVTVSRKSC